MICRDDLHQPWRVRFASFVCLSAILVFLPHLRAQTTITTLAGTEYVFTGDGKPALNAPLGLVASVTLDHNGNPVFSDPGNCVVLRLNPSGTLTVLAGNGILDFSGDGGAATNAALNTPQGVAFDSTGNLYIADSGNNRIRMVTPGGIISTVAGNGIQKFAGEGVPATQASLSLPLGVAVDSSNVLYIADLTETSNGTATRIRRVTSDGIIATIAGNGQPGPSPDGIPAATAALGDVEDLTVDSKGVIYLAEFSNNKVRKIDSSGNLTTLAGDGRALFAGDGGLATKASLYNPGGVAVDSAGNVYISDTNNSVIRRVNGQGIITTVAGTAGVFDFRGDGGAALNARFDGLFGLTVDSGGNIYVTDTDNNRLREVQYNGNVTGIVSTLAGNGTFRFFPDGTQAANAFLFEPHGVSTDGNGNVYIADTSASSIRKISSNGAISTIAGNGSRAFSGDNGPASLATLDDPANVISDSLGNLYIADSDNDLIRKIGTDGTITTIAGDATNPGVPGYAGDNGPATKATLSTPLDVIQDSAGNLYISDYGNNRIRKIAANGIITTVVGNGQPKFAGDNGPALQASLNGPRGLAFDPSGNLYIVDYGNSRIRRVSATDGTISTFAGGGPRLVSSVALPPTQAMLTAPLGITIDRSGNVFLSEATTNRVYEVSVSTGNISIVAGNGNIGFSGDGGPAAQAALDHPYGLALDGSGNLLIADSVNNRIRAILAAAPALNASPTSLTFTAKSAGGLTDAQSVMVTSGSTVTGLLYSVTLMTSSGGSWLKTTTVTAGAIPATVQIQADPTGLAPGSYQGSVVISAPNANPSTRTVAVTFTVQAPDPPLLTVGSGAGSTFLTFSLVQGAPPTSQSLSVSNQGGGSLNFSASASTDTGGSWLSVSPGSGSATPVQPTTINVQADPTGLTPGTYTGTVTVTAGVAGVVNIPVTMTVSGVTRHLLLSQVGLQFNAVFQGGAPLTQSFAVVNAGQGDLNWTVQSNTLTGGPWLIVTPPASTVSTAGATVPPSVTVAIDASGLTPGEYYGQIQVSSPDADNSPQSVTVVLDVLATGTDPGPDVRPTGLVFTGAAGTSPGSQNVFISNLTSATTTYASGRVTQDGGNWFVNAPTNDTVPPNQPVRVVVQPDFTSLAPGTFNGVLTLIFNGGVTRTINILSVVTGGASSQSSAEVARATTGVHAAGGCAPKSLKLQFVNPTAASNPVATQPVSVQLSAVDDCGSAMQAGTVKVTFSNHDPDMGMVQTGNGLWENTWQPKTASQVSMLAVAAQIGANGATILGSTTLTVTVSPGAATPVVSSGVLNAASLVANPVVAPGGLITIMGQGLASGTAPGQAPYGTQLGGSQVFLDNSPLALLYASDSQINAQVPYNLAVNTGHQLNVLRGQVPSIPVGVSVASAQPAIFTQSQDGTGQGDIFTVQANGQEILADPNAPAGAGDTLDILCTGVGSVSPSVAVGAPPPASPVVQAVNPVTVMIGGVPAQLLGASLSPSYPGVYRVLVAVPSGITPGNQVPVVLTVGNQPTASSPTTVTMAIH